MAAGWTGVSGAGVRVPRPADFDAFWSATLTAADALPLDPVLGRVPLRSTDTVDVHELAYTSLDDVRVAGWYATPTPAHVPPPWPGLLILPGYVSEPTVPKAWAQLGYAAVGVAPRGKLRSDRQYNPGYPGLLTDNIVDHHTYGYRGFYLDACRALDFLLGRDEVAHDRIGMHGSSQGGALSIVVSALRPEVVACAALAAPYLCGIMDAAALTHSHPYEEINDYLRLHPEREEAVRRTVAYYDGLNFAPRIRCPVRVTLGLADDVCPPETGYALYDALDCPKRLQTYERCAHDAGSHWDGVHVRAFLAEHLRPAGGGAP